jgi:hypothetical protein
MRTWIRNTAFFLADLRTGTPRKFVDLRFADLRFANLRFAICGFEICGLIITNLWISNLRTGRPQKFADLRLRNEPKNFRICDLRTKKKFVCPPLLTSYLILNNVHTVVPLLLALLNLRKGKV